MTAPPAPDAATLDCLGRACPVPVIELAKAITELAVGDEIVVIADDPGAKVDIPVWCRMKQQELLGVEVDGSVYRFRVRRAV